METIRDTISSLTGYGAQPKEEDVATQTAAPAQDPDISDRAPDQMPSDREQLKEPKNLVTQEGGFEDNSRPDRGGGAIAEAGLTGKIDPAVVEEKGKNLSGSGVDGSHSAVFGLTPDGHKHDDTTHGHGSLLPAHSKEVSNTASRKADD